MQNSSLKQSRKVGVSGSFQNQLMGNNTSAPVVGEYANELLYSDRRPYKVKEVSECGTKAILQHLSVSVVNGKYVFAETEYTINIEYRKKGWFTVANIIVFDKKYIKEMEEKHGRMFGAYLLNYEEKERVYFSRHTKQMEMWPQNIIEGVTKAKKEYSKISILFSATPDYYYDPSF